MRKIKFLFRLTTLLLVALFFSLSCFGSGNQYITNVEEELPYEYSFSKEYVVAGKRVLDLKINNKTDYHIKAIEIEIRVKDAFKEVISDWSTFADPQLEIPAHGSGKTRLTLTKRNILGTTVENVLDEAKYIDLRYKRIMLEGDILLEQEELYPELREITGSFRIEAIPIQSLSGDSLQKNLSDIDYGSGSTTNSVFEDNYYSFKSHKLSQLIGTLSEEGIMLKVDVTNISGQAAKRDWTENSPSIVTLTDSQGHQYTNYGVLFASKSAESMINGETKIRPGTTISMIYVFDKIEGYTPRALTVYFGENDYGEKVTYEQPEVGKKLRKNPNSIAGKDKFKTTNWVANITHYTPKVYQANQQKYGFGLKIKLENLSSQKINRPNIDIYAIGPGGLQSGGYCSGGSYEVASGANTNVFCTFYIKPTNFTTGTYEFRAEINTGTLFEPNIHTLEREFKISEL